MSTVMIYRWRRWNNVRGEYDTSPRWATCAFIRDPKNGGASIIGQGVEVDASIPDIFGQCPEGYEPE
jgi:hypothetical protein